MKSKKGFTLIELLAIIVILAIIAVITVPIILNIIENSKKGAATDSAYGYKDAVNKWYISKLQDDNGYTLNGSYTISDGKLNNIEIPISGDKPENGILTYTNNLLTGGCLTIGEYKVTFDSNGSVSKTEKGECEINVIPPQECFEFESNGTGTVEITAYRCGLEGEWDYDEDDRTIFPEPTEDAILNVKIPKTFAIDDNEVTVTSIGEDAFHEVGLISVEIPNSVVTIGKYAFASNQLISVEIPNSVTTIGEDAFEWNCLTNIEIPNSVTTIGTDAFNINKLPDNQAFIYKRNSDGTEDKTTIVSYGGINKNVIIPNSVTTIGADAFLNNKLTSVIIPNSVTSIEEYAFYGNCLTEIAIPNSVIIIGEQAFVGNDNLIINVKGYTEKPSGWDNNWNIIDINANVYYPVNWNYQGN